ncbi:MAG: FecR domain-containing protein [Prosthecobacter sp.]
MNSPPSSASDERFEELWTDYLEGELDEPGLAELRTLLGEDNGRLRQATELHQTHRMLGFLADEDRVGSEEFIRATMRKLPADSETFISRVVRTQQQHAPAAPQPRKTAWRSFGVAALGAAAALVLMVLFLWRETPGSDAPSVAASPVRITRLARAQFFGELNPQVDSAAQRGKDYILTEGLAELKFPSGATAILEAPAVFRVLGDELLAMDAGQCSVHAPPGAEGFRLETPASTVVDRGTRFSVRVNETSETEVQVIEGIADVYPVAGANAPARATQEVRLTEQQALRVLGHDTGVTTAAKFDGRSYRAELPDRVVSFTANTGADGDAESLTSVTVQREGKEARYPVEALIPSDVVWFKPSPGTKSPGHLIGPATLPTDRRTLFSSSSLISGAINPGGSREPLTSDPLLNDASKAGTPGMAVRFRQPVRNGPGPDVVFFEIQVVSLPPEGDAFHCSPLHFREGLRSQTFRKYDINLLSPEALRIVRPHLYTGSPVSSVDDLLSGKFDGRTFKMTYRVVAVGIDLSDLGYAAGEMVEGLFFQDAEDDDLRVDPVFIAGLP